MRDKNVPLSHPGTGNTEPPTVLASQTCAPMRDQTAAEIEDLEEIMASGGRLPVGLFQSELLTERNGVWVDRDGHPIGAEEEE